MLFFDYLKYSNSNFSMIEYIIQKRYVLRYLFLYHDTYLDDCITIYRDTQWIFAPLHIKEPSISSQPSSKPSGAICLSSPVHSFIEPMHRNKPNITVHSLISLLDSLSIIQHYYHTAHKSFQCTCFIISPLTGPTMISSWAVSEKLCTFCRKFWTPTLIISQTRVIPLW